MLSEEQQTRFAAFAPTAHCPGVFPYEPPGSWKGCWPRKGRSSFWQGQAAGKTTVLIHRIANLLRYGKGSDSQEVPDYVTQEDLAFLEGYAQTQNPTEQETSRANLLCAVELAAPWQVIAITFTNKAAGELKERLEQKIGPQALDIWAATFHPPACASSAGTLRSWASPPPLPFMIPTIPSGSSRRV